MQRVDEQSSQSREAEEGERVGGVGVEEGQAVRLMAEHQQPMQRVLPGNGNHIRE